MTKFKLLFAFIIFLIFNSLFNLLNAGNNIPLKMLAEPPIEYKNYPHNENFDEEYCKNHKRFEILNNRIGESAISWRNYDVLEYDLHIDWYGILTREVSYKIDSVLFGDHYIYDTTKIFDRAWTGTNNIKVRIDSVNTDQIVFDAKELEIINVKVDDKPLEITPEPEKDTLIIPLSNFDYKAGDTLTVSINYKFDNEKIESIQDGFYFYHKGDIKEFKYRENPDTVQERIAYTMSEPKDARYWMPCNDTPHDKALSKVHVTVPEGFNAASNGLLEELEKGTDKWIYHFDNKYPITTYLMSITASKFKEWSDTCKRITDSSDVEVKYYAWEKDYDAEASGGPYNAKKAFEPTVRMIEYYSGLFGEYPFDKYGMVGIQPFGFGGMEHQTITALNRVFLAESFSSMRVIAHELAHQWIGDKITCATWNDIWINEGGATWSEALWLDKIGGRDSYISWMYYKRLNYMGSGGLSHPAIYGLPTNTIFGRYAVLVYDKASWVYHMLSETLGRDKFLGALRSMMDKYAYNSLESMDFINSLKEDITDPVIPLDTFFNQWLYSPGHPVYRLESTPWVGENSKYIADVTVEQIQEGPDIPEVFHALLPLLFYGPDSTVARDTIINTERRQITTVELDFMPDSVKADMGSVLCELNSTLVSVERADIANAINNYRIYPNPVTSGKTARFNFSIDKPQQLNVEIIDRLGRMKKSVYKGFLSSGDYNFNFNTNNISPGLYFLKCSGNGSTFTRKFIIVD